MELRLSSKPATESRMTLNSVSPASVSPALVLHVVWQSNPGLSANIPSTEL